MLHHRHYQASAISANQAETQPNPNLILYRHLHQPQMELEHESTPTTTSRVDIHQPQQEDNSKHMVHPHRLYSSEKISTLPSLLITSNHHLEEKEYNTIEEDGDTCKSRSSSKDMEDLMSPQSNSNRAISKERLSFLNKYYSAQNVNSLFYEESITQQDNSVKDSSIGNTDEIELPKQQNALNIKDEVNPFATTPPQKTEI